MEGLDRFLDQQVEEQGLPRLESSNADADSESIHSAAQGLAGGFLAPSLGEDSSTFGSGVREHREEPIVEEPPQVIAGSRGAEQEFDHRVHRLRSEVIATPPAKFCAMVHADGQHGQLVAVAFRTRELDSHQVADLRQREHGSPRSRAPAFGGAAGFAVPGPHGGRRLRVLERLAGWAIGIRGSHGQVWTRRARERIPIGEAAGINCPRGDLVARRGSEPVLWICTSSSLQADRPDPAIDESLNVDAFVAQDPKNSGEQQGEQGEDEQLREHIGK